MRLPVRKTYKLFIGGQFPRSESGRHTRVEDANGVFVANVCRASRKDLRDAIRAARKAQEPWAARSAFQRAQILYRVAEMLEGRRATFDPLTPGGAAEVSASIDRVVWYAGWADKFPQLFSAVNPVAAPYFNFTTTVAVGVVVVFAPPSAPLLGLVSAIAPVILSGNTAVVAVDSPIPQVAMELAEALATSDLPGGVVNLLTGAAAELLETAGTHRDVDAVSAFGLDRDAAADLERRGAESMKRIKLQPDPGAEGWRDPGAQSPFQILPFVEFRTAWHPIGR